MQVVVLFASIRLYDARHYFTAAYNNGGRAAGDGANALPCETQSSAPCTHVPNVALARSLLGLLVVFTMNKPKKEIIISCNYLFF